MVSAEKKSAILMGCGSVLVVLGGVMAVLWPALFFTQLQKMMVLTNESASFALWRETPVPMYLEVFMFNISNVAELRAGTAARPRFTQLGPYVFRETHTKVNLTWNANGTVTYYNRRWWHFEPDMTNGSLSDQVVTINPVVASVAYMMRSQNAAVRLVVDGFLRSVHRDVFASANVSAWMFDGVPDRVLDIAERFPDLPINIPYDKFGWFYTRNGSAEFDGSFVMSTGAGDWSALGNIERWRGSARTPYAGACGDVRGSSGELWAPELGQPEVAIFASDICTYMMLAKNGSVTVEGIEGVQYAANSSVFDNGHHYPHMACYCDEPRTRDCVPSGALNVSSCRFGAPAFVSLPHMLMADPYYPSKIDGMEPNVNHTFRLSLEIFTGMPLSVSAQLQVNLLLRHVSLLTINNALPDPDTLVPMFWFRQELAVTPEYARLARSALTLRYGVPIGLYTLTAIGLVLVLVGLTLLVRRLLRAGDPPILRPDHDDQ